MENKRTQSDHEDIYNAHIDKIAKKCEEVRVILSEPLPLQLSTAENGKVDMGLPPFSELARPVLALFLNYVANNITQTVKFNGKVEGKRELAFWQNEVARLLHHPKLTSIPKKTRKLSEEEIMDSLLFKTAEIEAIEKEEKAKARAHLKVVPE